MSKCSRWLRKRGRIRGHIDVKRRGRRDGRGPDSALLRDRVASPEDLRLALRAATLYYLDGLTQAEIAARLGVSRPTAGRLVARAKAKGLVRIEVVVPPDMRDDLHADEERELELRFGLTEAVVAGHGIDVGAPGTARRVRSVGRAAAALLMRRLTPTTSSDSPGGRRQVAVAPRLAPGWRAVAPWSSSTAPCRAPRTRPAPSSSSAAARMCCGPTPSDCPHRCMPTRRRWRRCAATR